jgi:hypothetical protein
MARCIGNDSSARRAFRLLPARVVCRMSETVSNGDRRAGPLPESSPPGD